MIEIKKSIKPIKYENALSFMEERLNEIIEKKGNELIWVLEHKEVYTAGASYKNDELLEIKKNNNNLQYDDNYNYHIIDEKIDV